VNNKATGKRFPKTVRLIALCFFILKTIIHYSLFTVHYSLFVIHYLPVLQRKHPVTPVCDFFTKAIAHLSKTAKTFGGQLE
jgi:hypothetical protein